MIPVGRCVIRTAESVVFTDCPPGPVERYTSIRRSFGSISMSSSEESSSSGITSRLANEVCRRFCASNGEIRTSRCTPRSVDSRPYAFVPWTMNVELLIPASSP